MELIKEQECNKFVQNNFNTFIMQKAYEIRNVSLQQVLHISMQNEKSGLLSTENKKKPLHRR